MTHQTDVDVLIVGAGPTGLTLACLLARYGVKFRIIDKKKTTTSRSKALGIQARTLELFEQLELTGKILEMGHPATGLDLITRGKLRASLDLKMFGEGLTKYPYIQILEQSKTEQLLIEKLGSLKQGVHWQWELLSIRQHRDFVEATVTKFERIEKITAKYVVGADGARSLLRHQLQIPFLGGTYENRFMLADVALDGSFSNSHISLCLSDKGFAGIFPMAGTDRYRVIGTLRDEIPENADAYFPEVVREIKSQAGIPLKVRDPLWISAYKIHHRRVDRFQDHRCFLAGDAAHIHSPAGAQGMNTGIQDAFNLGWKLHLVLSGGATELLLKTYDEERLPFAKRLIKTTDRGFQFATSKNPFVKWTRLYLASIFVQALTPFRGVQKFIFKTISQIGISYAKSSLSGGKFAGSRIVIPEADGYFHAYVMGDPKDLKEVALVLRRFLGKLVKVHTLASFPEIQNLLSKHGVTQDGIILVRPDQYVGYLSHGVNAGDLSQYLGRHFKLKINDHGKAWNAAFDDEQLSL